MEKRFTVFRFLSQVFMIYGITMLLLNIFCILFGADAKGYSTIFSLAEAGISVSTSLEFLLAVIIVIVMSMFFMSDRIIKNMRHGARLVAMFVSIFVVIIGCVFLFGWFPPNDPIAWLMFVVCFGVSCTVSVAISTVAERQENKKLDEALKRIKEET